MVNIKKNPKKIYVRGRSRKICTWLAIVQILSFAVAYYFIKIISIIAEERIWLDFVISMLVMSIIVFLPIYLVIIQKKKGCIAYIILEDRVCKMRNKKAIKYDKIIQSCSLIQKIFFLITIEFLDTETGDKVVLKDVSKKILNYL